MTANPRTRIDNLMVQKGLVPSRQRARALILAGRVLVSEQKVDKPGLAFRENEPIRILGQDQRYVSRGGLKLEGALAHWAIAVEGRACLDIGTSTGGFTDCLLQHGASHVSCVDTGFGQIAMSLRQNSRVQLYERTNARLLQPGSLSSRATQLDLVSGSVPGPPSRPEPDQSSPLPELSLLVVDVSFISATLVLPPVLAAAASLNEAVVLVKPQFEAGRENVGKGGIVRDAFAHELAVQRVSACLAGLGCSSIETIESPITGMEGNREFLLHAMLKG